MKTKLLTLLSIVSLSVLGCTDVQFTPGELAEKAGGPTNPVGPITPIGQKTSETFTQTDTEGKTDILVVVDNSGSMFPNQEKMGQRIQSFLSHLSGVDWQMGITTTDVSGGTFSTNGDLVPFSGSSQRILTKYDSNYETSFLNTVTRTETFNCQSGTDSCPSKDEQPLLATLMAMQKSNSINSGFFRDDASLAIVVLSDEDELSDGPVGATQAQSVLDYAKSRFGAEKVIRGYGIIIEPGDQACFDEEVYGQYGTHVADLVQLTGGITGSICSTDYGQSLSNIGQQIRELVDSVELEKAAQADSVEISFDPPQSGVNWSLKDGNRVVFDNPPPVGTKITVDYTPKEDSAE